MHGTFRKPALFLWVIGVFTLAALAGCGSTGSSAVVVTGDFAVVFAKRANTTSGNPTTSITFAPGGDLMMANLASPSAPLVNLTASYTQGAGDVSDPEVSYDGRRVLFSMRGPNDRTWHIFEMDLATRALHRLVADDASANQGDDVDPAYLPDGRIVFTSNRQERSKALLTAQNTEAYTYLDEYDRERSTVLHIMNADGSNIHQISANQSHDRNPTVLRTGEILFARWDHLGARNHFPIFTADPDGTNIFIRYGAFSPGNSFLHPREMPNGKIMTTLMPLSGTHEGGALMVVDATNFSENNQPATTGVTGSGQQQVTLNEINFDTRRGLAPFGRYTTPYPLWDGTNRALVSWSPSRPTASVDPITGAPTQVEGLPQYGVYIFDLDLKTLRPIALPPDGFNYTDPIAVAPRPVPNTIPDRPLDQNLAAEGMGVLNVKSVYDTDFLDIMGDTVLAPDESIPKTAPPAGDTRSIVPDLAKLKDPARTTAAQRPARFLRVIRAVPTPSGLSREAIGETDMEMQQIVGYTEIEPDGSVRMKVPANTPLAIAVVDSNGMAFQTHTNWLQVQAGETRTCDGCHGPRRGSALNATPIAGNHPNTLIPAASGESMAETRTRLSPAQLTLKPDMKFIDVWTDPAAAGRAPDPALDITYAALTTKTPVAGIVNFPEHIAPLFTVDRGVNTCTNCHNNGLKDDPNSAGLDLRDSVSGTGRLVSYEALTLGAVLLDPVTGLPQITARDDGEIELAREDALVGSGGSHNSSRTSQLFEKLLEKPLNSGKPLPTVTVNHRGMMNTSELRLLAEWADLGGQYYNDPFIVASQGEFRSLDKIRGVTGLSETIFGSNVHPILMSRCAGCHQAFGGNGTTGNPVNPAFRPNMFVLTGDLEGDYNVTLTTISDVCTPAQNPLLLRPISTGGAPFPHPQIGTPAHPVLSISDPDYQTILAWIATGTCK